MPKQLLYEQTKSFPANLHHTPILHHMVKMTPQTMKTKYAWVCLIYKIQWKCEEEKYFNENYNQDFPLMKNLSDWLCDLTSTNIAGDGLTTVERQWYIFHRMPSHIIIFLDLFSKDLSKRIQYPFKELENWKNRPLQRANWKETRINLYNELVMERQELEEQGLYSKTHVKTH